MLLCEYYYYFFGSNSTLEEYTRLRWTLDTYICALFIFSKCITHIHQAEEIRLSTKSNILCKWLSRLPSCEQLSSEIKFCCGSRYALPWFLEFADKSNFALGNVPRLSGLPLNYWQASFIPARLFPECNVNSQ